MIFINQSQSQRDLSHGPDPVLCFIIVSVSGPVLQIFGEHVD